MRLLVCGSRYWLSEAEYRRVADEIEALAPALVMHGGAKGADECADLWCRTPPETRPVLVFRADWHAHGKGAGPRRNERMLRDGKPTRGLAFGPLWKRDGGAWRRTGTGDMVSRMLGAGLPVRWVESVDADPFELIAFPAPPKGGAS